VEIGGGIEVAVEAGATAGRTGFAVGAKATAGAQALKAIANNNTIMVVFITIPLAGWT
jgi:hypothetical protein